MRRIPCTLVLGLGVMFAAAGPADAQVLTWDEVLALDWSGSIQAKIKAATDGVFDEGPDYWYDCTDPWFCESDVVTDRLNFTTSLYNNRQQPLDDLIVLLAYKDGTFLSIRVGGWTLTPADFHDNSTPPFGPAGNRPGDGETALYNSAEGVAFVRLGLGVAGKDTVEFPVEINRGRGVFTIHFDFYGLVFDTRSTHSASEKADGGKGAAGDDEPDARATVVACTNAASHDITWDTPCYPSGTVQETWSRIKTFLKSRDSDSPKAP